MAGSSGSAGGMYTLKWAHHQNYLSSGLAQLLEDTDDPLTDVTLACQGHFIQAHKVVLSVSSTFFKQMFRANRSDKVGNTIVIVPHVTFKELKNLVRFIYNGQVNIPHEDLNRFLEAANVLQIEGLAADLENNDGNAVVNDTTSTFTPSDAAVTVTSKRGSSSSSHSVGIASQPNPNSGGPPVKRSRLSVSSGAVSVSTTPSQSTSALAGSVCPAQPTSTTRFALNSPCNNSSSSLVITGTTSVTLPVISESERDYDPLEDAGDGHSLEDSGEEMISLDTMKSEPIAVYSMTDDNEGELDSQSKINTRGNDSSGTMYSYESTVDHSLDAGRPGPSSGLVQQRAVIPPKSSKPTEVEGEIFHPEVPTHANNFAERTGIMIRCKKCEGEFISERFPMHTCLTFGDSTMHINVAQNFGTVEPVQCTICLRMFKNRNSLKVHKSTQHRDRLKEPASSGVRLGNFADVVIPVTAGESIIISQQTHHNQYPGTMSSPTQRSRSTSARLDIKPEPTLQQMQMSASARLQDMANQSRESSQYFFDELGLERGPSN